MFDFSVMASQEDVIIIVLHSIFKGMLNYINKKKGGRCHFPKVTMGLFFLQYYKIRRFIYQQ